MDLYEIGGYIGAFLTGLILGLLGGGGALLSIPVLVYLFHIPASVATGYSLFLVGTTALIGAFQNLRKKLVDFTALLYYGVPSVMAVYTVRRFVIPNLPEVIFSSGNFLLSKDHFILFLLSLVMLFAAYRMITASTGDKPKAIEGKGIDVVQLPLYAFLVGGFLGLVGAGGGFLMIPALVLFANLPMKKAIGTSLVLVAVNSLVGFMGDVHSSSEINWMFFVKFSVCSISGVMIGIYLHRFTDGEKLKKYFGWFIVLMAIVIIAREFWSAKV